MITARQKTVYYAKHNSTRRHFLSIEAAAKWLAWKVIFSKYVSHIEDGISAFNCAGFETTISEQMWVKENPEKCLTGLELRKLHKRLVNIIGKKAKEQGLWISVDEQMPEPYADVLVFSRTDGVAISYFHEDANCWDNYHPVTHWMPFPEPPED